MRSMTAVVLCAFLLPLSGQAQVERFLIVGDSWAEEQWLDDSHARVFADRGLEAVGVSGELTTTSGSTAAEWVMPVNLARIDSALAQYPHLDTVQLTVGGNDFLDSWNSSLSQSEFDALIGLIVQDVETVTDYILAQRPELEIVISLYDYPNFEDTRNGLIWTFVCSGLWSDLGQPTPEQLNTAAVQVIDAIEGHADSDPRIRHVRQLGEAQSFFGATMLPPPGDITRPSPPEAMRTRFIAGGLDCFHFNSTAYDVLVDNLVDGFIAQRYSPGLGLSIESLSVEYNGQSQAVGVTSTPPDQALIVTYDGRTQAPVDAGSYAVLVTAPGWLETLSTSFEILPASQSIEFEVPQTLSSDSATLEIPASATSGLPVTVELLSGPASLAGGVLSLDGVAGVVELQATQSGSANWQAAATVNRSIQIIEVLDPLFQDRFQD